MSLSDLELVAQAMAPIDRSAGQGEKILTDRSRDRTAEPTAQGKPANGSGVHPASAPDSADNLQNAPSRTAPTTSIDPSLIANLSQSDLASIQPLLTALSNMNGLENLDDLDEDDPQFQEIMRQLDAADGVADVLDEKLDGLIGQLREEESKMEQEKEMEQAKATVKPSQEK